MYATDYFSSSYAAARAKFLEACAARGLDVEHHPHPARGRDGEELATDVARVGPAAASHVLLTLSATHGVEGFCGSGAQVGALRTGLYDGLPDNFAVVLIHAINPYGFSWLRRVTHENVDLNRNHVDHAAPYPENPGYARLREAICPREWTDASRRASAAAFAEFTREHGLAALRKAIAGGQYVDPDGLFFGGNAPTWSARTLAAIVAAHAAGARHVACVDYHTGLGPYGYGEPISDHALAEPGHARLGAWLGEEQVTSTDDGSSTSAPLTGINRVGIAAAAPAAELAMVTLEFGTVPMERVRDALRADCWLHNHGDLESAQGRAIKAEIRRCFYPDSDDWKDLVWVRALHTERRLLAGLATLA